MNALLIRCLFCCAGLVAALWSASPSEAATQAGRLAIQAAPNVVLIVCDDQAWFHFGFMGNREIRTPNLDRLARQSAVFTRGYVPTSVCRPSLATIITGRYPHEHLFGTGIGGLGAPPNRVRSQFQRHPPLPKLLARRNYRSMQTGKWWEGNYALAGFTHGMTTGKPVVGSVGKNSDEPTGHKGLGPLDRGMLFLAGAEGLRIGREGLEPIRRFVADRGQRPFLVWYAPMIPHTPHNPPERLLRKYRGADRAERVAKYMAMCEWFDESCGRLLALIDEQGLSDKTLVAFVVDNGYVQLPGINWFDKRSKLSPYEAGIRTPMMLRWPKRVKPARYDTLVHSIDLAPTILAAAAIQPPPGLPGINLLDICDGKRPARNTVFGATFRRKSPKPKRAADKVDYRWCISDRWKLIVPRDGTRPVELFNVIDDPHEAKNLAAHQPRRVAELRKKLDQWWSLSDSSN